MNPTPPFDEALALFHQFLIHEGLSTDLVWVFSEDVSLYRTNFWVKEPIPASNVDLAREYFEWGRNQSRSIALEASFLVNGRPACSVSVANDEISRRSTQIHFHMKRRTPMVEATVIRSNFWWRFRCGLNKRRSLVHAFKWIPSRTEAQNWIKQFNLQ